MVSEFCSIDGESRLGNLRKKLAASASQQRGKKTQ
jgi:hypothetical protein